DRCPVAEQEGERERQSGPRAAGPERLVLDQPEQKKRGDRDDVASLLLDDLLRALERGPQPGLVDGPGRLDAVALQQSVVKGDRLIEVGIDHSRATPL